MEEKTIEFEDIGKVTFAKSSQSRRIGISISPLKGVKVSMPEYASYTDASRFVEEKKPWIITHLRKIENSRSLFDENTNFRTRTRKLKIIIDECDKVKIKLTNEFILVLHPSTINIKNPRIQIFIRKAIEEVWKHEAKALLPQRIKYLAEINNLKYRKVRIRQNETRWGSCNYLNDISLNAYLMQLPDHLIDYVILHELAHTIHKNHGKDFWNFLEIICLHARKKDKELNKLPIGRY